MGWGGLILIVNVCLQVDGPITTEAYKLGGGACKQKLQYFAFSVSPQMTLNAMNI